MTRLAAALGLVVLLCACTSQQIEQAGKSVASAAPAVVNDALIVAQVEGALLAADGDSALHTAVASHGGVVTLSGRVKSASVRDRFVDRARGVQGVTRVVSRLAVDARLPTVSNGAADLALTIAVEANLAGQTGQNALDIHVAAHGGVVTLSGPIETAALHATVLATARGTRGVRSVRDRLVPGT